MNAARTAALLWLLAGCSDAELGRAESAITDGWVDFGHPAVGAIDSPAGFECSGTLVGARSVLTAAHCISTSETNYRFEVEGRRYAVVSAVAHPRYDRSTQENDLGVMVLDAAPPITPMALSPDPPILGLPIVVVGLGCTGGSTKCVYGVKRMTRNTIAAMTPEELVFTSAIGEAGGHCDGDSGGPTLAVAGLVEAQEVLIGVHSWGPVVCSGDNHDARVDGQLAWIQQQTKGDVVIAPHSPFSVQSPSSGSPGCAVGGVNGVDARALLAPLVLVLVGLRRRRALGR